MSMNIKALWEQVNSHRFHGCLSHLKTTESRRRRKEDEDPLNVSAFIKDEDKLLSSKSVRLLGRKTQVFTDAKKLTRTRDAHVKEVVARSVTISDILGLNTDLVRAAVWGHDMGHGPFGHQGEAWLAKAMGRPFCHEVMGPIIAQKIERKGQGLNLNWHTLEL